MLGCDVYHMLYVLQYVEGKFDPKIDQKIISKSISLILGFLETFSIYEYDVFITSFLIQKYLPKNIKFRS